MARLILSLDGQVLAEYNMSKERYTLGRLPDNDVRIDNAAVSGHHALIINILNDSFLEDLNSTNGTYVNGKLIKKHALQHGDVDHHRPPSPAFRGYADGGSRPGRIREDHGDPPRPGQRSADPGRHRGARRSARRHRRNRPQRLPDGRSRSRSCRCCPDSSRGANWSSARHSRRWVGLASRSPPLRAVRTGTRSFTSKAPMRGTTRWSTGSRRARRHDACRTTTSSRWRA